MCSISINVIVLFIIIYYIIIVAFPLSAKYVTLNDLEWPFYVK